MKRFRAERGLKDNNHKEIIEALYVIPDLWLQDLSSTGGGLTDIVVCYNSNVIWIEIKTPTGKIKKNQLEFLSSYPGYCGVVWTIGQACSLVCEPGSYSLTNLQQTRIKRYLETMKTSKVSIKQYIDIIEGEVHYE